MTHAGRIPFIIFIGAMLAAPLQAASNGWGAIFYTRYQTSKVYHAPVHAAAVCGTLKANEMVKADFKQGGWYRVFKPSEAVRDPTNAVGYMDAEDLFPDPLPPGPIAGGLGESPAVARSIEALPKLELPGKRDVILLTSSEPARQPEAPAAPAPADPTPVGDSAVRFEDSDWSVLESKDLGNTLKSRNASTADARTEGRFILVRFKVSNKTKKDEPIVNTPVVVDSGGRAYRHFDGDLLYLPDEANTLTFEAIPAGAARDFSAIYEVSVDASELKFRARELKSGKTADIAIDP